MNLSLKRGELAEWLLAKDGEWINVQVKQSKAGKLYAQVDNWKPKESSGLQPQRAEVSVDLDDDLPF